MDCVFAMTQQLESTVVKRVVILGRERFKAERDIGMSKERGRFFHDAAQGIEVKSVELAGVVIGRCPQFGKGCNMVEKRCVLGGPQCEGPFTIWAVQVVTFVRHLRLTFLRAANFIAYHIKK